MSRSLFYITFVWIPAHIGIPGNERADTLAKEGATNGQNEADSRLSKEEAKTMVWKYCRSRWESIYANTGNESKYKTFWPSATRNQFDGNISRKYSSILFRINTGHCKLNEHLHKIGCHHNGLCEDCNIPESLEHYFLNCPKYSVWRTELIKSAEKHSIEKTLPELFKNPYTRFLLVEFVLMTGRIL